MEEIRIGYLNERPRKQTERSITSRSTSGSAWWTRRMSCQLAAWGVERSWVKATWTCSALRCFTPLSIQKSQLSRKLLTDDLEYLTPAELPIATGQGFQGRVGQGERKSTKI